MYKLLLILKYLRKRRLAWWSVLAVALCVTMVLVVMSVMGGWISMFQESFHGLSGDIVIQSERFQGIPYYSEIIQRMKDEMPDLKAAAPIVRTWGVVKIGRTFPYSSQRIATSRGATRVYQSPPEMEAGVQVIGYPPNIHGVNDFVDSLHRLKDTDNLAFSLWDDVQYVPPRSNYTGDVHHWRGMVVGQGVIGIKRSQAGVAQRPEGLYNAFAYLTVMPNDVGGSPMDMTNAVTDAFWIVDDSRTKVHIVDSKTVYVPFDRLQQLLRMQGDDQDPARCHEIQIALKPGADLEAAKERVIAIMETVREGQARKAAEAKFSPGDDAARKQEKIADELSRIRIDFPYKVQTWREFYGSFLSAVEHEKGLLAILFGLISIVAVFLIFCIFYMVVAEKTRDIGTIKAVGASSGGVAAIFVGYGAVIGVIGGLLGLLFSYLIVHNINELHAWLGRSTGIVMWNPETYLFDTIPSRMNPHETAVIVGIAIIASIVGALLPAIRAARMHPIEALRWE